MGSQRVRCNGATDHTHIVYVLIIVILERSLIFPRVQGLEANEKVKGENISLVSPQPGSRMIPRIDLIRNRELRANEPL